MKYSSIPTAQLLVQYCKERNIKNIIVSPGSRNAPLTIGFTEDTFFNCYSIVDERCAAFFALGMAQNIGEPVVVVCTSGSALLNYYPAIAEAFYSDIPLIVVSADRPSYGIDIGDGQTIRQKNVFANHIGYSANLMQDVSHATHKIMQFGKHLLKNDISIRENQTAIESFNAVEVHKALNIAFLENSPVHINVPFEEPLYNIVDIPTITAFPISVAEAKDQIAKDLGKFVKIWKSAKRKMVLVGVNKPNAVEQKYLDVLANDPSVLVFTETTSNIHHPNFFNSIDSILAPIEIGDNRNRLFSDLRPEVLLTFGGLVVSKKIKAFLRNYSPEHHWHIDPKKANDTFFCLSHHFKCSINTFFGSFLDKIKNTDTNYHRQWASIKEQCNIKRKKYLGQIDFSDMLAYSIIIKSIPANYQVHLSNSSTVRYAQLFPMDSSLEVFCNRGTSGIDGSSSTAIGASVHNGRPTILITGDLSFLYDSNALWNKYIKPDLRIIVINNSGGGIFRILPGNDDSENYKDYFETAHNLDASYLCEMYQLEYAVASDETTLETVLSNFYDKSPIPKLLEIKTPRIINNKVLLSYFDYLSSEK